MGFNLGWNVWWTMKAPMNRFLEGEFPNVALGHSAIAWIRAVNKGNAIDCSHLGSGAETGVIRTVLVKLTRAYVISVFEWCWHTIESLTLRIRRRRAGGVDDTTDAIRAVACIRFVERSRFAGVTESQHLG